MDELAEYLATSSEDGVWEQIQTEAREEAGREPVLVSFPAERTSRQVSAD